MLRDLDKLRRWAAAVEHDARSVLAGEWRVSVDALYVLTVRRDDLCEQVLLENRVDEDAWPPDAWALDRRDTTLELEAAEAVADEFLEVLRLWDVTWLSCVQHDLTVSHCSAEWICAGSPVHGIALLGALQPHDTTRRTNSGKPLARWWSFPIAPTTVTADVVTVSRERRKESVEGGLWEQ